jgi:hypothetical protein
MYTEVWLEFWEWLVLMACGSIFMARSTPYRPDTLPAVMLHTTELKARQGMYILSLLAAQQQTPAMGLQPKGLP